MPVGSTPPVGCPVAAEHPAFEKEIYPILKLY